MKTKLLLMSGITTLLFTGCVVDVADLQKKETFNSKIIKDLVTDENVTTAGTTSLLTKKKQDDNSPLLSKPKISKITISGYIDTDGDYHEKEVIHLKVEDAKFLENKKYFSINTLE